MNKEQLMLMRNEIFQEPIDLEKIEKVLMEISETDSPIIIANIIHYVYKRPDIKEQYLAWKRSDVMDEI